MKFYFLIALVMIFVISGCLGKQPSAEESTIIVKLDKTNYDWGEPINITVKNNLNSPIWYAKHVDCGLDFYILENCKNENKTAREEYGKSTICNWFAPMHEFTKLESRQSFEENIQRFEPGCYFLTFPYSLKSKKGAMEWGVDTLETQSKEFFILPPESLSSCEKVHDNYKDFCYHELAYSTRQTSVCEKIKNPDESVGCYMDLAVSIPDAALCEKATKGRRDWCYKQIAEMKKDSSICRFINNSDIQKTCLEKSMVVLK